jgi:hypothetical protein
MQHSYHVIPATVDCMDVMHADAVCMHAGACTDTSKGASGHTKGPMAYWREATGALFDWSKVTIQPPKPEARTECAQAVDISHGSPGGGKGAFELISPHIPVHRTTVLHSRG